MSSRIEELFLSHEGNRIDKWEQYIKIYEIELSRFAQLERPVSLLEIGVQNGGSLELWGKLFPPRSKIHGVDIDPRVAQIEFSNPNIRVDIIDGTTDAIVDLLAGKDFDVIIDDGSHVSKDIISSFRKCFGMVRPGGLYIIEDLHAAYYETLGGGIFEEHSAMNFLKKLLDAMHADYIDQDPINAGADLEFLHRYNRVVGRVSFYDSVAVIEKLAKPKSQPYRRVLSGEVSTTVNASRWLEALPRPQLGTMLLSSVAGQQLDHALISKIEELEGNLKAAAIRYESLESDMAFLRREINQNRAQAEEAKAALKKAEMAAVQEREKLLRIQELERATMHQIIEELRGKAARAYNAWSWKVRAINRLKASRQL
ncbi:class I SAM-dependent methyltransferase [Methylobacterium fujisawaense]